MLAAESTSVEEQHIRDIRRDLLRASESLRHVKNLERALDLLSDQLYQKPTHFLLELIQNADDNKYQVNDPIVTFTYDESRLRIDCNEVGFSRDNVEAICQIGQSTKAGNTGITRYVGEKGIGFKSVFKVATKVWISSNGYTFKFDKSLPLGMIAPVWETFPQPTKSGVTSMLLELSSTYDKTILIKELMNLDARMMIFLQRLRQINIQIHIADCETWRTSIKKFENMVGGQSKIMLLQDSKSSVYTISKHKAANMPPEPKREGQKGSEILIAFPALLKQAEVKERQQVYAFLPIRDYGFKFLLQGDFLLSASREDILSDSPWNRALRDCFVDAFVALVKDSHESFLHYNWPLFLPVEISTSDFFESARTSIIDRLRRDLVVSSWAGKYSLPNKLMLVPEQFRTKAGSPLLKFSSTSSLFLSDQYAEQTFEPLAKLGVRKMELPDFVMALQEVIKSDRIAFQGRSSDWHSEFARNLLAALWKSDVDRIQWNIIRELPVIPLENYEWISPARAAESGVFLPPGLGDEINFEGLDIKLVLKEAASDESRASLYRHLDIPTINQIDICHYIAKSLCREGGPPQTVAGHTLVSQTIFLFKTGWRNPSGLDLWFKTQTGGFDQGSRLYIKTSSKYSASSYFSALPELFLSDMYLDEVSKASINTAEFQTWLEDCMHIWEIPRLLVVTDTLSTVPQMSICPDFSRLVGNPQNAAWVYLLRDNFRKYSLLFDLEELLKDKLYARKLGQLNEDLRLEHQKFIESIGMLNITCIGNSLAQLKEAYLPRLGVKEDTNGRVPLVDVADPEHTDWQFLKRFGLGVEPDLKMYIRCLEKLSRSRAKRLAPSELDKKVARYLDQIQARHLEDIILVKDSFKQKALIRVPPINSTQTDRWVKSIQCLWEGDDCFRILPVLKRLYPGNGTLFAKVLGCGNAKLADLFTEATLLRLGDDIDHIMLIFCEIEKRLRDEEADPSNYFGQFASYDIFPVTSVGKMSDLYPTYDKLCKVQQSVEWFIADRQNLRQSFKDLLPLLAFQVGNVRHLKKTMERMKLDRYRLSRCAQSRAETFGVSVLDRKLSQDLVRRVPFILRLIPTTIPMKSKRRIARQLRTLQVFLADDRLTQQWSVQVEGGQTVHGRPYRANVIFVPEKDEKLHIFLSHKYFARSVCKNDIVQHFADFCEIQDGTHLLNMALWESFEEVESTFQDYGIADYDALIDSNEPLDEDNNDVAEMDPKPNEEESLCNANDDSVQYEHDTEVYGESIEEFHDEIQNAEPLGTFTRIGDQGSEAGPNRFCNEAPGQSMQLVCGNCAKGHIKFAQIELQTVFGTPITEGGQRRANWPLSLQPQPALSGGFSGFIRILSSPSQTATNNRTSASIQSSEADTQFRGEHFFSIVLADFLRGVYEPSQHWTSSLRTRAGYEPFHGSSITHASFTLPDCAGTVTAAMLKEHSDLAKLWATEPPTWHFEVKTTTGKLNAPFTLTNAQIDRARAFSMQSLSKGSQIPKHISVLVRVFNVDSVLGPDAYMYRDPWEMFLAGDITIRADTVYRCHVGQDVDDSGQVHNNGAPTTNGGMAATVPSAVPVNNLNPPPPYWSEQDKAEAQPITRRFGLSCFTKRRHKS